MTPAPSQWANALFVSQASELGGAEYFLRDLVVASGLRWDVCFLSEGPAAAAFRALGGKVVVLSADNRVLAVKRDASLLAMLRAAAGVCTAAVRVAAQARGHAVICANSQKALFVCAIAGVLARRPVVWVLHDIITDRAFARANRYAAVLFANLFAARVVVNSQKTKEAFIAAGGRAGRIRLVYNGFDPAQWGRRDAQRRAQLRDSFDLAGRPVIGLFGRLTPWKGQDVFLRALAALPQAGGILVGGALFGEQAHEDALRQLVITLGLEERVRFLGNRSDVAELMGAVDVAVHASTEPEPFGRIVVEAMLCGTPVVATAGGGIDEIVRDGATGLLVPPSQPALLAAAVSRLLADPDAAARMAVAAHADVSRRFDIKNTSRAMQDVFSDVLASGRGRSKAAEDQPG